jgi:hypothetical protein
LAAAALLMVTVSWVAFLVWIFLSVI